MIRTLPLTLCAFAMSATMAVSAAISVTGPVVVADPPEPGASTTTENFGLPPTPFGFEIVNSGIGATIGPSGSDPLEFASDPSTFEVIDLGEDFLLDDSNQLNWEPFASILFGKSVLSNIGDQAYVGFRFPAYREDTNGVVDVNTVTATTLDITDVVEVVAPSIYGYGFVDITRGSVIVNGYTYNAAGGVTTPSSVPPIAPIPLPAGVLLLMTGLGTLALMKRRTVV